MTLNRHYIQNVLQQELDRFRGNGLPKKPSVSVADRSQEALPIRARRLSSSTGTDSNGEAMDAFPEDALTLEEAYEAREDDEEVSHG